jgi:nicotinate-nucleotide pyrophosphorylase (carboxylating)
MTINQVIELAFKEDMPKGDVTTDSLDVISYPGTAKLIAKSDLVLSGQDLFEKCIQFLDPHCNLRWMFQDGQHILAKQTICVLKGNLIPILKAERVALNFLGRFSGIATMTKKFVDEVSSTQTHIIDTRKTTPLFRDFEKKAVRDGGGQNYRRDLSEFAMIKENHARVAGSLEMAIDMVRSKTKKYLVAEAHSLEDVDICIAKRVDRVLLDNMDLATIKKALEKIPKTIDTEASGNMTLERVAKVAETGVKYISIGALTHSAPTADISLLFEW